MQIMYDNAKDLLYLRLDARAQDVENRRVTEDIVLDIGKDEKLVGIEILDASQHVRLDGLFPVDYEKTAPSIAMVGEEPEEYGSKK